jgi:hypothetical protein
MRDAIGIIQQKRVPAATSGASAFFCTHRSHLREIRMLRPDGRNGLAGALLSRAKVDDRERETLQGPPASDLVGRRCGAIC